MGHTNELLHYIHVVGYVSVEGGGLVEPGGLGSRELVSFPDSRWAIRMQKREVWFQFVMQESNSNC